MFMMCTNIICTLLYSYRFPNVNFYQRKKKTRKSREEKIYIIIQCGHYLDKNWIKCEPTNVQFKLNWVFIIMTHSTNQPEMYNWIESLKWNRFSFGSCQWHIIAHMWVCVLVYNCIWKGKQKIEMAIASRFFFTLFTMLTIVFDCKIFSNYM